ncbi:hypothetical protein [Streptomyces litchfieldiae]|uniref:Integral membrane protein n=1 Tax=Streptomyces litchfieldiae TaxID=3075543 RepID=A0ABU2MVM3_9ACTN|nr:hypothetical protein [Streptomyces sp. DSM 44938]MDT0345343.1 hypothetical protein [Streptomyces sp. DSM 44938]
MLAFLATEDKNADAARQSAGPWRPGPLSWARRSRARGAAIGAAVRAGLNAGAREGMLRALSTAVRHVEDVAARAARAIRAPGALRDENAAGQGPSAADLADLNQARKAARASLREVADVFQGARWRTPGAIGHQAGRVMLVTLAYLAGLALLVLAGVPEPGGHVLLLIVLGPLLGSIGVRCLGWRAMAALTVLTLILPAIALFFGGHAYHDALGERTTATVTARSGSGGENYELREEPGGEDLGTAAIPPKEAVEVGERLEVSVDPLGWVAPFPVDRLGGTAPWGVLLGACALGTLVAAPADLAREVRRVRRRVGAAT